VYSLVEYSGNVDRPAFYSPCIAVRQFTVRRPVIQALDNDANVSLHCMQLFLRSLWLHCFISGE